MRALKKESSDLSLFIERLKASKKALSNDLRHHTSHIKATISSKVSSINWRCESILSSLAECIPVRRLSLITAFKVLPLPLIMKIKIKGDRGSP